MSIYIHNSLSKQKEEYKPITENSVKMYVCGPTVYDEPHIGHARGAFVFDIIRNYFKYKGYNVKYVRNVTDVDDKIIDKARKLVGADGDLKKAIKEVADKYLTKYNEDMEALEIERPDVEPKATEHIDDMISIIKVLLEKGHAYEADGDIYFRVKKFKGYGQLSHQSPEKMEVGARVSPGENKEDPLDFALWKKSKESEPSWKIGPIEGRPGWHIECSAMSMKHLGENFDIHGGGIDLIFPHHENEIAQSEFYSGKRFANYWMHNGLITINGQKMAKSLGNYLSVSDYLDKYKDPEILKIFFLSSHYRSPLDFTDGQMKAAKVAKDRFNLLFDRTEEFISKAPFGKLKKSQCKILDELKSKFEKAMDDDFNTAAALAALFEAVTTGNSILDSDELDLKEKTAFLRALVSQIKKLVSVLALNFTKQEVSSKFKEMVEKKLVQREKARIKNSYKLADSIRKELAQQNVIIEDTKDGTKWRLK